MKNSIKFMILAFSLLMSLAAQVFGQREQIGSVDFTSTALQTIDGGTNNLIDASTKVNKTFFYDNTSQKLLFGGLFSQVFPSAQDQFGNGLILVTVTGTNYGYYRVDNLPGTGASANNIYRLDWNATNQRFTFSKLSQNFNGVGDGCNGEVKAIQVIGSAKWRHLCRWGLYGSGGQYSSPMLRRVFRKYRMAAIVSIEHPWLHWRLGMGH